MPRIERLQQNTPDWHRWRLQGLGASDAPVIMGEAAFKTPRMLWSIKTGRAQEDAAGPAARRGRELERLARRTYERQLASRWSRFAWCTTNWNGCVHRSTGSASMVLSCSRSSARLMCATRPPPNREACLRSTTRSCSTSSRSRGRRRPTTGRSMAAREAWSEYAPIAIPEAAFGCRGRVLAAGQG